MSYYYKSKIYDQYVIDAVIYPSQGDIVYDTIEIFNNEKMRIDFSKIDYRCSAFNIQNQQLSKIIVDWGDGKIDRLSKSLMNKSSSIGTYDPISWKQATHLFNVDKRYEYSTDNINVLPKIKITLYNTFNDKVNIFIPYKVIYKSIYDIGTNFSMLNANVTNSNLTSYVLKENKDNTIVIASTKDWRKIYGNDSQVVRVSDTTISSNYSDEFVNEDSIIWDWKSVPQVSLSVEQKTNVSTGNNLQYFDCNFEQITVNLDSWKPKCYIFTKSIDQNDEVIYGQKQITITADNIWAEDRHYKVFYTQDGQKLTLPNGIYVNYLDIVGINDIQGKSSIIYKSIPQLSDDDIHPCCLQQKNGFIPNKDVTQKQFKLQYELGQYGVPYHYDITPQMITDAKIYIKPISIQLDGMENPVQADGNILFEYPIDLYKNELIIPTKSIPDGQYKSFVHVQDVLGYSTSDIYRAGEVFDAGTFNIKYTNFGIIDNLNVVKNQQKVIFSWDVKDYTELDTIKFSVKNVDTKDYIMNYKLDYNKFSPIYNQDNSVTFSQEKYLEQIQDGTYQIQAHHVLNMTSFGGSRSNFSTTSYNFEYPRPNITINKVIPYIRYDVNDDINPFKEYIYIEGMEIDNFFLQNTQFHWKEYNTDLNEESKTNITSYNVVNGLNIDFNIKNVLYNDGVRFAFSGYKTKDAIYKRDNKKSMFDFEQNNTIFKKVHSNTACEKMFEKSQTQENIKTSADKYYQEGNDKKYLTTRDIQISSVVDINKSHVLIDGENRYYFYNTDDEKPVTYTWGDVEKPIVFGTKVYYKNEEDEKVKYTRFYGDKFEIFDTSKIQKLKSVKQFFTNENGNPIFSVTKKYIPQYDLGKFVIRWQEDSQIVSLPYYDCIYGKLDIIDYNTNNVVHTVDIRHLQNNTETIMLKLGLYKVRLSYSSIHTASDDNVIQYQIDNFNDLKLYVEQDEVLTVKTPICSSLKNNAKYYRISFMWDLHHIAARNLSLYVQVQDDQPKQYDVSKYSYYQPSNQFQEGKKVTIWFTCESNVINWQSNDKKIGLYTFVPEKPEQNLTKTT